MEELLQKIDQIFLANDDVAAQLEVNFELFAKNLDDILSGRRENSITPEQKKKMKRLDNEENATVVSESTITEFSEANCTIRPVRAAKLRIESFKEQSLTAKLRRPSGAEDTLSMTRFATTHDSNVNSKGEVEDDNKNKDDFLETAKQVDESVLVVSNEKMPEIELSDSIETDKLMPPPVEIPKKNVTRKTQQNEKVEPITRSSRIRIKQEKLSIAAAVEMSNNVPSDMIHDAELKAENPEEEAAKRKTRTKTKSKRQFKCMPIVEVKQEHEEQSHSKEDANKIHSKDKQKPSMESVYEDAIYYDSNKQQDTVNQCEKVLEDVQSTKEKSKLPDGPKEAPADATFVATKDAPGAEGDATFTMSKVAQQLDQGGDLKLTSNENNATFCLNNKTSETQSKGHGNGNEIMRSSIMTEEDSADDEMMPPPQPVLAKVKSNKELFNPCLQSPVKKKVEAFEKHSTALASPAITRQTGTRSKLKENKDPVPGSSKSNTPLLRREISKLLTPNQTNTTPNIGIQNSKHLASSTSKLAQMQKQSKPPITAIGKTQSLSCDNLTEDVKRTGYNKLQLLADEKKRKREQKQQQAALIRETREKERAEKLKKVMQEKEEKARRKAHDAEMRKVLDDINKNLKHQDHDEREREAQKRNEKKQQEKIVAEAAQREREMLDNLKIQKSKEELQKKLLQNQMLQDGKTSAKIPTKPKLAYDFDLLNSDDSTDEEDKPSSRRPRPPTWSKSSMRSILIDRQTDLATKIVDSFFSVQPMTPDLSEIFPSIDPRYLKRNSSVYWKTPPRYSELPKY